MSFARVAALPAGPYLPNTEYQVSSDGQTVQTYLVGNDGVARRVNDPQAAAAAATALVGLDKRLRFDADQALTDPQRATARKNTGTIEQGAVYYGFSTAAQSLALAQQSVAKSIAEGQSLTRAEFTRGRYRLDNSPSNRANALKASRSGAATWPKLQLPVISYADGVPRVVPSGQVLERGTKNLLDSPDFAGAVVGVKGAGGALPTGWDGILVGWEVVSVGVVDGAVRLRLHCTRGTNTASPSIKLCGAVNGKNVDPAVNGGFAFSGLARLVSVSGACTGAFFNMVEMNGANSTPVGSAASPVLLSTGSFQPLVAFRGTTGHFISPRLSFLVSDATSPFDVVIELTLLQVEDAASVFDYTSWTATLRGVEEASLTTPTYDPSVDVFTQGDASGGWTLGKANAGVASLSAPAGSLLLRESMAFPAGTLGGWEARAAFAMGLYPSVMGSPPAVPLGVWNGLQQSAVLHDGLYYSIISANGSDFKGNKPWAYQLSKNKYRDERFEVRTGDLCYVDPLDSKKERSMLQGGWYGTPILPGQMYEVRGAFMLEPGDPISPDPSQFMVLLQEHVKWGAVTPLGGFSPPLAFELLPGDYFGLDLRATTQFPIGAAPGDYPVKPGVVWQSPTPLQRGKLYHFVLRTLFDPTPGGAGRVQLWLNGVLVCDYQGVVGYPGAIGYSLDYGLYRHTAPETVAIHFYNMRPPTPVALGAALPVPDEIV
jgi:hypothetical protein